MSKRTVILIVLCATLGAGAYFIVREPEPQSFSPIDAGFTSQDIQAMKDHFAGSLRSVQGTVKGIIVHENGTRTLSVFTKIPDISAVNFFEGDAPPTTGKIIGVLITPQTLIEGPEKFSEGDMVNVLLDKGVYEGDVFNAVKLSLYNKELEFKRLAEYSDSIGGTIRAVGKNYFIIRTKVTDLSKLASTTSDFSGEFVVPRVEKEYKVFFDRNTNFSNKSVNDLRVGVNIVAWDDENVLTKNAFTVVRVRFEK